MKNKFFALFGLVLTVLFASCEVGLGSAVDTAAPTVSIEYPPKGAIIRDSFVMSGKCNDETGLRQVDVKVYKTSDLSEKKLEDATPVLTQTAEFADEKKQSWKITLNNLKDGKYEIADGSYSVYVVATDNSGRKSDSGINIALTIDNTKPLLILENPSTTLQQNPDYPSVTPDIKDASGFGTQLKIQGSVTDATIDETHVKGDLYFHVFDADTNEYIASNSKSAISSSLGVVVGEYVKEDKTSTLQATATTDDQKFYKKIYNATDSSAVYRKFKITVADSARPYKGEGSNSDTAEGVRGNVTSEYYIKDEIYTILTKAGGAQEIQNIIKGVSTLDEATQKTLLADFKKHAHSTDDITSDDSSRSATSTYVAPVGTFYMVPTNAPTYEVSSLEVFDGNWDGNSISSSGSVTILAKVGLASTPFPVNYEEIFAVNLYEVGDDGKKTEDQKPCATIKNFDSEGKLLPKAERPITWARSGSNYTGRFNLSKDFVTVGKKYLIELEGHDQDDIEFDNVNIKYCFTVEKSSTPPTVTISGYGSSANVGTSVYLNQVTKDGNVQAHDLVISGTAKSNSGDENGKVTIYPVIKDTEYTDLGFTTKSNTDCTWTITIPGEKFTASNYDSVDEINGTINAYHYNIVLLAKDELSNETKKDVSAIYDVAAPSLSIDNVSSVVTYQEETTLKVNGETFKAQPKVGYVNDTVTFKGTVSDNDKVTSGYHVFYAVPADKVNDLYAAIKSKEYAPFKDYILEELELNGNPVSESDPKTGDGFYYNTSTNETVKVNTKKYANGNDVANESVLVCHIEAKDRAGNEILYVYKYSESNTGYKDELVIHQFTDYPQIALTNGDLTVSDSDNIQAGTNLFNQKDNNKLGISVSDDDGIGKIQVCYRTYGSSEDFSLLGEYDAGGKTTSSRQVALEQTSATKLPEGFYEIYITAIDSKGVPAVTDTFAICISNDSPSFTFINPAKNEEVFESAVFTAIGSVKGQLKSGTKIKRGTKEITVNDDGTWSDEITCVKVDGNGDVIYTDDKPTNVDLPDMTDEYKVTAEDGTVSWVKNGISTTDGLLYTLNYSVTDQFDRETSDSVSFKSDFVKPIVKLNNASDKVYVGTSFTTIYTFSGEIVEANGVESLEYHIDDGTETDQSKWKWENAGNQKQFSASVDFSGKTGSTLTVYFRATDAAKLVSANTDDSKCEVVFLSSGPSFSDVKVTSNGTEISAQNGIYYAKGDYTISGKVESPALLVDTTGKYISCADGKIYVTETTSTGVYTFSKEFKNPTSGSNTVVFTATDQAKQSKEERISVVVDTTAPSIDISSVNNVVTYDEDKTFNVNGSTLNAKAGTGYVNGTITVSGTILDDYFVSGSYVAKSGTKEIASGDISSSKFSFDIDTTKGTNDEELTIEVTAKDKAENSSKKTYTYNGKNLVINQLTDYPVVSLTNANDTIVSVDNISEGNNLFAQSGNNKLTGTVTDDNGIDTIDIQYKKASDSDYSSFIKNPISVGGKTSYSFSQELKDSSGNALAEGEYNVRFVVKDKKSDSTKEVTLTTTAFTIYISNESAKISIESPTAGSYWSDQKAVTVSGKVTGALKDGLTLTRGDVSIKVDSSTGEFTDSSDLAKLLNTTTHEPVANSGITKDSDTYTVTYTFSDRFGRSSTATTTFLFDNVKPVVNLKALTSGETEDYIPTSSKTYSVSGSVTEEHLNKIYYSLDAKDWSKAKEVGTQKDFNYSADISGITVDSFTVYFKAIDDAKNESEVVERKVNRVAAPTISINEPDVSSSTTVYKKAEYDVKATLTTTALKSLVLNDGTSSTDVTTKVSSGVYTEKFRKSANFTLTLTDKAGQVATTSFDVTYDVTDPVVEVSQVTPIVTSSEIEEVKKALKTYTNGAVNGTITVSGTSSDNDKVNISQILILDKDGKTIYSATVGETIASGSPISVPSGVTNNVNNYKFNIDTTKLTDSIGYTIRLSSTDRAGNTKDTDYPVYVCQATDIPTMNFSNGDISITDEDNITSGSNLFGMGTNELYITADDDDGVQKITYTVDGGTDVKTLVENKSSTSVSAKFNIKDLGAGVHSLKFTVTDINGKTQNFPSEDGTTIKVAYDNDVPDIQVVKLGDNTYSSGMYAPAKFTTTGNAKDSSGTVKIYVRETDATGTTTESLLGTVTDCSTTEKAWTGKEVENTESGNKERVFVAKDKYGREKELTIKYVVDNVKPEFKSEYIELSGIINNASVPTKLSDYKAADIWFSGNSFTISGKAVTSGDVTNLPIVEEHLKNVKLYKDSVSDANLVSTLTPTGNNQFSGTISFDSNGTHTLVLVAEDDAGNNSGNLEVTVNIDTESPTISTKEIYLTNPSKDTSATAITEGSVVSSDKLYIKYTVTDGTSGIKSVVLYKAAKISEENIIGRADYTSPTAGEQTGVIEVDVSNFTSTEYDFNIVVTDAAGNSITNDYPNFILDRDAPKVTYSSPDAKSTVNKTIEIKGTISDTNVPDKWGIGLKIKENGETSYADVSNVTISASGNDFTISGIDTTEYADGQTEFVVIATDKAGNTITVPANDEEIKTKSLIVTIDQDSDRPVISLNSISTLGTTTIQNGTIAGTIDDDDGISTFEILVLKSSEKLDQTSQDKINAAGWVTITLDSGKNNWSYTYGAGSTNLDGDYKIYFRVTDSKNGVFISSETDSESDAKAKLTCPKVQYAGTNQISSAVSFSIDTQPPTIKSVTYNVNGTGSTFEDSAWKELALNTLVGGQNYKYGKFRLLTYDTVTPQDELKVSLTIGNLELSTAATDDSKKITLSAVKDSTTGYLYFETPVVDFSTMATGNYSITASSSDKADKPANYSMTIIVDNTAPVTIKDVSPTSKEEVSGDITIKGQVSDDSTANSGISEMYYVLPKSSITSTDAVAAGDKADDPTDFGSKWVKIELDGSTVTWNFTTPSGSNLYNKSSDIGEGYAAYKDSSSDGIYNIPVWFKLVDNAGNVGYNTDTTIRYNPNARKPKVSITSPEHTDWDKDNNNYGYVTMGGTVRITGIAERGSGCTSEESVEGVYLQFDMDGDGTFENGVASDGSKIAGCPYEVSAVVSIPGTSEKGILVSGTTSWKYELNVSGLTGLIYTSDDPDVVATKKTLNVRAIAVNNAYNSSQLAGAWSDVVHISVNNEIPAFDKTAEQLRQYSGEIAISDGNISGGTLVKTISYTEDEYLSGLNWYVTGKVSSKAGIKTITQTSGNTVNTLIEVTKDSDGNPSVTTGSEYVLSAVKDSGLITSITYLIPMNLTESSTGWKVTIEATDAADSGSKSNKATYSVNIDNAAPTFADTNSTSTETLGDIILYSGSYGETQLNTTENKVQNSNGSFTLAGRINEAGSGYNKVLFYFKRTNSSGSDVRVYNPMESHGTDNTANRSDIVSTKTSGSVYINEEKLPALYLESLTRDDTDETKITHDSIKANKNIRVGGLVKIGGVYVLIKSVDYTNGTVTLAESSSASNTTAEFIYAMVIDHSGESEGTDKAGNNIIKNDDGDGMVESYSKSGSNYTWDAAIDSTNIPDGPIEIHVVAFDNADNSSHGWTKTSVSNNAPRIARVKLATDLSGNGSFEDSESQVFTYLESDTKDWSETTKSSGTDVWNLDSSEKGTNGWTIKNKLQVTPEFVGGTAPFTWVFSKKSGVDTTDDKTRNLTSAEKTSESGVKTSVISGNKVAFELANTDFDTSSTDFEDQTNTYRFSFWDSTEETTTGTDSQWTVLNVQLKQDLVDNVGPTSTINPFYWNSASDNSLYENSLKNGHIELEDDLPDTFTTGGSGVNDRDPKVSGKVVFTGTAYDNVRLDSLWIRFDDAATTPATSYTFANPAAGSSYTGTTTNYVCAAVYSTSNNNWTVPTATMADNGWVFEITKETLDQSGHTVEWSLSLDTEKLAKVAASDLKLQVMAVEHLDGSNSQAASEGYKVDVVPYITNLGTRLSGLERKSPSVYGRTALGKYPVYFYSKHKSGTPTGESVTVDGFNLSGGTVYVGSANGIDLDSNNAFTVSATTPSDKLSVKVNEIESLNNKNGNDVTGSYKGDYKTNDYAYCYNRSPNGRNNNLLTDDVEILVWQLKSKAVIPSSENAEATVMHVNPANGMLGFAFTHGANLVSYPNGTTNSYQNWARDWTAISQNTVEFAYDKAGNMYGTHHGTDTATNRDYMKAARFRITSSLWGVTSDFTTTDDANTAYGNKNALRLEYMGYGNTIMNTLTPERFKGSKIATNNYATSKTNLYLMYYDSSMDELKFKAGGPVPTTFDGDSDYSSATTSFNDFVDDAYENTAAYKTDYTHVSIVSNSSSSYRASSSFAISVVPSTDGAEDVVVAVWCDESTGNLWYSYNKNPLTNAGSHDSNGVLNMNTTSDNSSLAEGVWAKPIAILDGDAVSDCAIAVDDDGHIHIASYSRDEGGSLCYTYLASYDSSYDANNTVFVDSYDSNGTYLTMDFAKNSAGKTIPYIGYYTSRGYPKYAYLVDTTSSSVGSGVMGDTGYYPKAGADDDNMSTGAWELIMLPTTSILNVSNTSKISIGVWRDPLTGIVKEIPKRDDENAGTASGIVGGNGTDNAVLAYGIKIDGKIYVETAQLK